jgi:lipooligosaccharide transport system ATP-binding protein
MPRDVLFSVEHLVKRYNGHTVVDDLSFEIRAGECLGVIGPNGAGKTTTIRLCLGLAAAESGRIRAFGWEVPAQVRQAKQRIGVVSQFDSLDPDFTCTENLAVFARYFGVPRAVVAERTPKLLEFAALQSKAQAKPSELSGGMRRRLSLARALVNDPQARHLMWERLKRLLQQGKSILLTTHFMDEAERLCDRLIVLDHGRKIAEGTPRGLIAEHLESDVIEVYGDGAQEAAQPLAGLCERIEHSGETTFLYLNRPQPVLERLAAHPGVRYLHRPANLEDLFLKLTGRQIRDDA